MVSHNQKVKGIFFVHCENFTFMIADFIVWISAFEVYRQELVLGILSFSLIAFLLKIKRKKEFGSLDNPWYTFNWIIMLLGAILQIFYLLALGEEAIWFCKPDDVGWLWTVVNFLIFSLFVYIQASAFIETLGDFNYNHQGEVEWKLGLYSWAAAALLHLLASFFYPSAIIIIYLGLMVVQIIQIVKIFKKMLYNDGWGLALFTTLFYLIVSIATFWILIYFTPILILGLIAAGALYLLSSPSSSATKSTSSTSQTQERCSICGRNPNFCDCASKRFRELQEREERQKTERKIRNIKDELGI